MFTVKVVFSDGRETVKETKEVFYMPPEGSRGWRVMYRDFGNDNMLYEVEDGDVYVMNESGRTVANYTLTKRQA